MVCACIRVQVVRVDRSGEAASNGSFAKGRAAHYGLIMPNAKAPSRSFLPPFDDYPFPYLSPHHMIHHALHISQSPAHYTHTPFNFHLFTTPNILIRLFLSLTHTNLCLVSVSLTSSGRSPILIQLLVLLLPPATLHCLSNAPHQPKNKSCPFVSKSRVVKHKQSINNDLIKDRASSKTPRNNNGE